MFPGSTGANMTTSREYNNVPTREFWTSVVIVILPLIAFPQFSPAVTPYGPQAYASMERGEKGRGEEKSLCQRGCRHMSFRAYGQKVTGLGSNGIDLICFTSDRGGERTAVLAARRSECIIYMNVSAKHNRLFKPLSLLKSSLIHTLICLFTHVIHQFNH